MKEQDVFVAYWRGNRSSVIIEGVFPDMATAKLHCETEIGQGPPVHVPLQWAGDLAHAQARYPNGIMVVVERTKFGLGRAAVF